MKLGSSNDLSFKRSHSSSKHLDSYGAVNGLLHHNIISHPVNEKQTVNATFYKWI